ncbi:alpha/beta hydrolase [Algoriphagus zhangzhouensis]|uniref:Acetyl esterase/lipase n=1 Tax=Algoriphagus zhangzhouensis TaxID=1073327 RepID=A0A1M7Z7T3_9BACT|nr:alpha/beta hydrolase [Algoriphagus zhangzhouensis]TDY49321.1 acetyl esterase/lipase [Algoriphagus zhangzhouensis]SHO60766.1 Acetyl esterase/lipase [Algoriphagus zhangzhouensis]
MKKASLFLFAFLLFRIGYSQTNPMMKLFPEGTKLHGNIPYMQDTLKKHLLDIYLPPNAKGNVPLVIWVHGGGWLSNDKYADMGYMKETIAEIINQGYALASIDYRFSTQATFPAQMLDCNASISYLYDNASKYGFDTDRFALMGFSAGGHLASMLGLTNNQKVNEFFVPGTSKDFQFKAVVDFYGPADLTLFPGAIDAKSPEGLLIGAAPLDRPDLAKMASPVSFVDEKDPPFLIIHGEKDDLVSPRQSHLLNAWLKVKGVPTDMIVVPGAPHFGSMFDAPEIRERVFAFLKEHLK